MLVTIHSKKCFKINRHGFNQPMRYVAI